MGTWNSNIDDILEGLYSDLHNDANQSLEDIRDAVRLRAPHPSKGNPYSKGSTVASIVVNSEDGDDFDERTADAIKVGGESVEAQVGEEPKYLQLQPYEFGGEVIAPLKYAPHIEWGTTKMAAQPFMTLGAADSFEAIVERYRETIRRNVYKHSLRLSE